jgi:hypothetical protein
MGEHNRMIEATGAAQQYVVVRQSARSYRPAEPVAGPFGTWREAFLARCRLIAAAARGPLGAGDAFEVQPA